jgi:hypothetical protein
VEFISLVMLFGVRVLCGALTVVGIDRSFDRIIVGRENGNS